MAKSAFITSSIEQRPKVRAENPKLKFGQVAKKIGAMWRALSPQERAVYEANAKNQ
jgi:hypothetical protein